MTSRLRAFVLLLAALWLPLQTLAAMAMPLCRHAIEQPAEVVASPCHEHESEHGQAADASGSGATCDNCELCHLACAGFMPSAPLSGAAAASGSGYLLPVGVVPPSHVGEPPHHPPRNPV